MSAWRESQASALDDQATAIGAALAELDNVHALLEARGNDKLCSELRGFAAGLRSEASEMASEARALRASPGGRNGFPLTVTTRPPRRRAEAVDEPKELSP